MGKNKYRRKSDTAIQSFRRRPAGGSEYGASILIVTEGVNTEPAYFQLLGEQFASPTVELISFGAGRGDPRALADEALRIQNERKRKSKAVKIGIHQLREFDSIWIVFDTDVLTPDKLTNGIQYAESKGIKIAYSEPCFEYWMLLHAQYTTAQMRKCKDVYPYLKEAFGWNDYSKDGKKASEVKGIMRALVVKSFLVQAVQNAGKVRSYHEEADSPFPANSSTDVDKLLRSINDSVGPAHKFL